MGAFEAENEPQSERSAARRLEESTPHGPHGALGHEDADADAVTPIPVGDLVSGRWVVDGVLGNGAMGVVCAAHHVDLGQRVAVKFLRATYARNESIVQRFLDEARAAAALRSEHIVRVFDIGETSTGLPYFVMEYLEGTTLEARIRSEGPVSPERAIDYVLQACDGLREVHSAGIVHRDVKPENLFLATTGGNRKEVVKVVDFGIAKRLDAARAKIVTGPQDKIGSPCYMSPEQMVSPKTVDPRTDVWALGVVLYQSLTGRLPFDGNTLEEMFEQIQSVDAVPPSRFRSQVDFALDAIVARCLRKDANDRFQSIEELAAELERYRSPAEWRSSAPEKVWQQGSVSDAPLSAPPRPKAKGPAWPVAVATVVGAAVTITAAVLVWTSRDSAPESAPVAAARPGAPRDLADTRGASGPPALMPLGAVPAQGAAPAPDIESEAPTIPAEREVKRDAAELARLKKQARARAKAASRAAPAPRAEKAPVAAPPAPTPVEEAPPPPPREEPAAAVPEEAPMPSGDDAYPEYLKRNGWRPLRDVLSEIDSKSPRPPPQKAAPEDPPPPVPAPPESEPHTTEPAP